MRRVRVFEHISLDGIIAPEGPGVEQAYSDGGWTTSYRSPEGAQIVAEAQGEGFDLLLGRRTYDQWAGYWPGVTGGLFAGRMNGARKYVATHRPESLGWGPAEGVGPDVLEGVRRLKNADGPDLIVWGSSTVVPVLLGAGLVDELTLFVYPVLLGQGKRLFGDEFGGGGGEGRLELEGTRTTPTGVVMCRYRCLRRVVGGAEVK